jgi:hypothetical protein
LRFVCKLYLGCFLPLSTLTPYHYCHDGVQTTLFISE